MACWQLRCAYLRQKCCRGPKTSIGSRVQIAPTGRNHLHHLCSRCDLTADSNKINQPTSRRKAAPTHPQPCRTHRFHDGLSCRNFSVSSLYLQRPSIDHKPAPRQSPCAGQPWKGDRFAMPSRKRSLQEVDTASSEQPKDSSLIHRLRNSFYFANLYQWICIFGKVVKIDDNLGIEVRALGIDVPITNATPALLTFILQDLETECLKHGSMALQEIGLSMLKHLSSHRGLTYVCQHTPSSCG